MAEKLPAVLPTVPEASAEPGLGSTGEPILVALVVAISALTAPARRRPWRPWRPGSRSLRWTTPPATWSVCHAGAPAPPGSSTPISGSPRATASPAGSTPRPGSPPSTCQLPTSVRRPAQRAAGADL